MANKLNYNNIPQNGLVLDMPLDGNANARVGANGTATNVTWVKSDKGYTKQAGSFNGSNSYIYTTGPDFFGTQPFTFSVYTKLNTLVNHNSIIGINDGSVDAGTYDKAIQILSTGQVRFYGWDGGLKYGYGPSNIIAGKWYHIVGIYDGTNLITYINGIAGNPVACASTYNHTTPLVTFSSTAGSLPRVDGTIQLVKIYNRALSQEEIHNLYLEGQRLFNTKPAYPQLLSGLVGYWDFKNGNLNNLVDGTLATNSGATLTTDHLGRANNAYSFNGSSSTIQNLYRQPITINPDFTISILFNTSISPINEGMSFTNYNNVSALIIIGGRPTNLLVFQYRDTADNLLSLTVTNTTFFNGQWHLLTGTKVGTLATLYLDGVSIGTLTGPIMTGHFDSGQNFLLGSRGVTPFSYYNGKFNMPILLNRALTAPEVKQLYNLTSKEYIYPFPRQTTLGLTKGLVMHLDKNGNDLSGNGNNGTLTAVTPTKIGQIDGGVYNGSSSNITIPIGLPPIATEITICLWAKPTNNTVQTTIINTSVNTSNWINIDLPWINNNIYWDFGNITNGRLVTTFDITWLNKPALWVFVSGVNGMKIYRNNQLLASRIGYASYTKGSDILYMGRYPISNTYWSGSIYEPKIRNRALTAKEVEQEYYNTKGNFIY